MCPSANALRAFWEDVKSTPQYLSHPIRGRLNHESLAIPISVHGDGTPITGLGKAWGKLMDIWSWSSLVASGPTELSYLVIFMLLEAVQTSGAAGKTLLYIFRKLKWSLEHLWLGTWPEVDELGNPMPEGSPTGLLAGGHYACVRGLIGDLDYMFKHLGMPNYNILDGPCGWCVCNSTTAPWWDFRKNAEGVKRTHTIATWRAMGRQNDHPLFNVPGVSILTVKPDWMHIKYLGLDKILYGSVLFCLTRYVFIGEPAQNLANIQKYIFDIYKRDKVKTRFSHIKVSMFSNKAKAKLRGKAAEIKCLGPVLLEIWKNESRD